MSPGAVTASTALSAHGGALTAASLTQTLTLTLALTRSRRCLFY